MKQKFVFYEHTERASLRNQAFRRYHSSKGETDLQGGGGRGEIIVKKLLLLNRKSKPLDLKKNNTGRARFPNSQIAGTLCQPHFGGKMH